MQKLEGYEKAMLASRDQQISLTDPDCRSMATSIASSRAAGWKLEESVARYLAQLDTADLQEPSEALAAKTTHLKEKSQWTRRTISSSRTR
jgi:hypothetical protein